MFDEGLLRSAAIAALNNSQGYLEEAELLLAHGHHARALSLSILGKEEAGKALMFALAALDAVPRLRDLIRSHRYQGVTDHVLKEVLADLASTVEYVVDEHANIVASEVPEAGGMALSTWLAHFFDQCVRATEGYLLKPKAARQVHETLKRMAEEFRARLRNAPDMPRSQTPDEKKMAGLYVDISGGVLSTPASITERETRSALAALTGTLERLRRFSLALEDDSIWSDLRSRYTASQK